LSSSSYLTISVVTGFEVAAVLLSTVVVLVASGDFAFADVIGFPSQDTNKLEHKSSVNIFKYKDFLFIILSSYL
jgi:hypothetical protein